MTESESESMAPNRFSGTPEGSQRVDCLLLPRLAWMMHFDKTGDVDDVCKRFNISRKTFYKWAKRYRDSRNDTASLMDLPRRPHHSPGATPESSIRILREAKARTGFGQRRLRTYLKKHYDLSLSERTIWKILKRFENLPTPDNSTTLYEPDPSAAAVG